MLAFTNTRSTLQRKAKASMPKRNMGKCFFVQDLQNGVEETIKAIQKVQTQKVVVFTL